MSAGQLRARLTAQPFVPFRVVMSNGESYEVRHPENVLLTKRELFVGQPSAGASNGLPEYAAVCALLHIAGAEFTSAEST